jgi:cation diffusion facilitator family transporter
MNMATELGITTTAIVMLMCMKERTTSIRATKWFTAMKWISLTVHIGATHASAATQNHDMCAAFVHVAADAVVSVLAIIGLLLGRFFGWVFMDPIMGIIGALVIANWAYGLIRDTGGILLDMSADKAIADKLRHMIESGGDLLADLHIWRLGPGHYGAIVSIVTAKSRDVDYYRSCLSRFPVLVCDH